MSGIVSTAMRIARGAIGTPIASAIGATEVTKLNWPGRLTVPKVVVAATATPAASASGVRPMPSQCAT